MCVGINNSKLSKVGKQLQVKKNLLLGSFLKIFSFLSYIYKYVRSIGSLDENSCYRGSFVKTVLV